MYRIFKYASLCECVVMGLKSRKREQSRKIIPYSMSNLKSTGTEGFIPVFDLGIASAMRRARKYAITFTILNK